MSGRRSMEGRFFSIASPQQSLGLFNIYNLHNSQSQVSEQIRFCCERVAIFQYVADLTAVVINFSVIDIGITLNHLEV